MSTEKLLEEILTSLKGVLLMLEFADSGGIRNVENLYREERRNQVKRFHQLLKEQERLHGKCPRQLMLRLHSAFKQAYPLHIYQFKTKVDARYSYPYVRTHQESLECWRRNLDNSYLRHPTKGKKTTAAKACKEWMNRKRKPSEKVTFTSIEELFPK